MKRFELGILLPFVLLVGLTPVLASASTADGPAAGEEGEAGQDMASFTQQPPWNTFSWTLGPATGELGDLATVEVPEGYAFTGAEGTQGVLEMLQNPVSGNEVGLMMPDRMSNQWIAVFEFDDVGYVSDDEKDEIDADELFESFAEGTKQANEVRRERGWTEVHLTGWGKEPFYSEKTHNLEWALKAESEGEPILNYNTRLLGRGGVMSVTLIVDPQQLDASLVEYQKVLSDFAYEDGNRYGDYRTGDKVAEYGLIALMAGGGAAIAAKTGLLAQIAILFKKAWKLLILGIAAVGVGIKKFFNRVAGKE